MPLPILRVTSAPTNETLVRYIHQTESNWTGDVAESAALDVGTAWSNAQLSRVAEANRVLEAALPEGVAPAEAVEQADAHFSSQGSTCLEWIMNPSATVQQTEPLAEHLVSQKGYIRLARDIFHLDRIVASTVVPSAAGLIIIPARASYKHAMTLYHEWASESNNPKLAESEVMHLDNPHYDALIALKNGRAVAHIGVLAVGEIGRIDQVVVSPQFRRQLLGTLMMGRIMEVCARALFKHVLLAVEGGNTPAVRLYQKFGFRKIGQIVAYRKG
jgi:ribosomal protein S18 acetylase RimI-like enzyme